MVLITQQGSHTGGQNSNFFLQNFHDKKKGSVPSEGLLVLFLSKSVNTMTLAENQLYRLLFGPDAGDHFFRTGFYWTLKNIILTVFFNNL